MKPAFLTRAVHQSCQSGDSAHRRPMKSLRRNKKWDVVTFDMGVNNCAVAFESGRTGVRSGTILTGMACRASQNWPSRRGAVRVGAPVACRAGRIRSSCQLASPRNSRACYIGAARSPTSSARAGEIACLSAGSSPMSPPRANAA
jgi:hypothetical protein